MVLLLAYAPTGWFDAASSVGELWGYYARPEAAFYIPSFLPYVPEFSAYIAKPYGLSELTVTTVSFARRGIGIAMKATSASTHYSRFELAIASNIHARGISFGVSLKGQTEKFGASSSAEAFTLDLTASSVVKEVGFYAAARNATSPNIELVAGLAVRLAGLSGVLEFTSQSHQEPCTKSAVKAELTKSLNFTFGLSSNPKIYGLSVHFRLKGIELLYSIKFHEYLRETHAVGMCYQFG